MVTASASAIADSTARLVASQSLCEPSGSITIFPPPLLENTIPYLSLGTVLRMNLKTGFYEDEEVTEDDH